MLACLHVSVQVALRLLDGDFPSEHVRMFAVRALETLSDEQLEDYLLQLVQVSQTNLSTFPSSTATLYTCSIVVFSCRR